MVVRVVIPDKLPCSEASSFVVSFNDPLPQGQDDFVLIFKGLVSGTRSHGHAKRIDSNTLIATTGEHDVAETVKVSVTAKKAANIKSFQMAFLTPFQMICRLLPDDGAVHSAVAIARCLQLPHHNTSVSVLDDELTAICERTAVNVPDDLFFKSFFGGLILRICFKCVRHLLGLISHALCTLLFTTAGCRDTLLHFTAEKGLHKFASYLLGRSSGACSAFRSLNDDDLTPKDIANKQMNCDDILQVFQDFEENSPIDNVPLIETASRQPMKKNKSFLAHVIKETPKQDKDKVKRHRSLFKRWRPKRKNGDKKTSKLDKSQKPPMPSPFRHSTTNKIQMTPLPVAMSSDSASAAHSDTDEDDIQYSHSESGEASGDEDLLGDQSTQNKCHGDVILPPRQLHSFIGTAMVKRAYIPGIHDPTDSLEVQTGELLDVIDVGGAWVSVFSRGRYGRVMVSSVELQLFNNDAPDYEDVVIEPARVKNDNDEEVPDYVPPNQTSDVGGGTVYVAQYDWEPQQADQLGFSTGDDIYILEQNQDGWWLGYIEGKAYAKGLVPATYIAKKVSGKTTDGGSHQSGSSSFSDLSVCSRVSTNSASSRTSAGTALSTVSGSSLGSVHHNTKPPGQRQLHEASSQSPSAKQLPFLGSLKKQLQTLAESEDGRTKPPGSRLSQVDRSQTESKPNLPPSNQSRPKLALPPRRTDDFLLALKPILPVHIPQSDQKVDRPRSESKANLPSSNQSKPRPKTDDFLPPPRHILPARISQSDKERPRSAPSSPLLLQKETYPTGTATDIQKFERGPCSGDTPTYASRTSLSRTNPESPITGKSNSLLNSPLFQRRAAATRKVAQPREELGHCQDVSAASLSSSKVNHAQKWRAIYDYTAADASELSMKVGDVINVYLEGSGNGWFSASFRGNKGFVPSNYVEQI